MEIKGLDPQKDQKLYRIVENVMKMYNFKKIRVKIAPNFQNVRVAPFFGIKFGKPLLDKLSEKEIEGILAHEFSHLFNYDWLSQATIYLIFALPLILTIISFNNLDPSVGAFLILISAAIWLYGIKVRNWAGLMNEYRADREAVIKTKNQGALKSALIFMFSEPLSSMKRPNVFMVVVLSILLLARYFFGPTHPHLKERIDYLDFAERMLKS